MNQEVARTVDDETKEKEKRRVTLAVFTYNQEAYVREALLSALGQTYSPLEIIFSDDCSADGTFGIIQEIATLYHGHHRLVLNRNEANLGMAGHVNRVMGLATGDLIVAAAGDDISLPYRVERLVAHLTQHPRCYSLHSNMVIIDRHGEQLRAWVPDGELAPVCSLENMVMHGVGVLGATHAWRRDVFEHFGPLDERVIREDAAIPFRAALLGDVCFVNDVLVRYRRHDANLYKFRNQMTSAAELHADWRLHADGAVGTYSTMLSDLVRYAQICPVQSPRLEGLRKQVEKRLLIAQIEARLTDEVSSIRKAILLFKGVLHGAGPRQIVRWVLMQWLPRTYLARVRKRVTMKS